MIRADSISQPVAAVLHAEFFIVVDFGVSGVDVDCQSL
jgi:hypothetical protein